MFILSHVISEETEAQRHVVIKTFQLFSWLLGQGQFQTGCRKVEAFEHYSGTIPGSVIPAVTDWWWWAGRLGTGGEGRFKDGV